MTPLPARYRGRRALMAAPADGLMDWDGMDDLLGADALEPQLWGHEFAPFATPPRRVPPVAPAGCAPQPTPLPPPSQGAGGLPADANERPWCVAGSAPRAHRAARALVWAFFAPWRASACQRAPQGPSGAAGHAAERRTAGACLRCHTSRASHAACTWSVRSPRLLSQRRMSGDGSAGPGPASLDAARQLNDLGGDRAADSAQVFCSWSAVPRGSR